MSRRSDRIIEFSKDAIDALPVPTSGRAEWWDETVRSLSCRVTSTGSKSFYWVGRTAGKCQRIMLGTWPAMNVAGARDDAKRISGDAVDGQVLIPRRLKRKGEWTLGELFEWYMRSHSKPHKRTWKIDEKRFARVMSQWESWVVSRITQDIVREKYLDLGEKNGHYAANKFLELLGHMFQLGKESNTVHVPCGNPTIGIARYRVEPRDRFLNGDELPRFLKAVSELRQETSRDFMLLCLWIGARRNNICSMRWDEIDMKSGVWTIPKSKAKSGRTIYVAIPEPALEILKRRKESESGPWVLSSRSSTGHYSQPCNAIKSVLKRSRLEDVRIHDLRRTLASWMVVDSEINVIAKHLGHNSVESAQIYARLADKKVRAAVNAATKAMQQAGK